MPNFTYVGVDKLNSKMPNITADYVFDNYYGGVSINDEQYTVSVTDCEFYDFYKLKLKSGRWYENGANELVVTANANLALNSKYTIENVEYTVVGILKDDNFLMISGWNNQISGLFNETNAKSILTANKNISNLLNQVGSIYIFNKDIDQKSLETNVETLKNNYAEVQTITQLIENTNDDKKFLQDRLLSLLIVIFIDFIVTVSLMNIVIIYKSKKDLEIYMKLGYTIEKIRNNIVLYFLSIFLFVSAVMFLIIIFLSKKIDVFISVMLVFLILCISIILTLIGTYFIINRRKMNVVKK
ncbi:MAG: ABC transporter permease [Clostridia bacterium]